MTNNTARPSLTELDRRAIAKARELADAYDLDAIRKVAGTPASADPAMVFAQAFGAAQVWLRELAALVERLDGQR